ncbi:hypothetical protein BSU04_10980 [Caballeronia sordidicola]|uniref:Uncharacterized protein n=1 Tax=Caballeronia sordidicola TaxID=196367 RepID=A0A226X5C0_CABSO|nr:hypothetical protein BSU04_10980 [Caballeronia sordidicola]
MKATFDKSNQGFLTAALADRFAPTAAKPALVYPAAAAFAVTLAARTDRPAKAG